MAAAFNESKDFYMQTYISVVVGITILDFYLNSLICTSISINFWQDCFLKSPDIYRYRYLFDSVNLDSGVVEGGREPMKLPWGTEMIRPTDGKCNHIFD